MIDFARLPEQLEAEAACAERPNCVVEIEAGLLRAAAREIERLRESLAYNARVIEAQALDLKSLSNRRRDILTDTVEHMRAEALGHAAHRTDSARRELDALKRREAERKANLAIAADACTCKAPAGHDVGCASWAVLDEAAW